MFMQPHSIRTKGALWRSSQGLQPIHGLPHAVNMNIVFSIVACLLRCQTEARLPGACAATWHSRGMSAVAQQSAATAIP